MLWPAILLVVGGCGRVVFDPAAGLIVSTTLDRMGGPPTISSTDELMTADLSLREALAIAANHEGPDLITFSAAVFPKASPGTIELATPLLIDGVNTVVDGTERGVIVSSTNTFADPLLHVVGNSVYLIELTIKGGSKPRVQVEGTEAKLFNLQFPPGAGGVLVMGSSGVKIVSCVFETPTADAIVITKSSDVTIAYNSIVHATGIPVLAQQSSGLTIQRNTIEFDVAATFPGIRLETVDYSLVADNVIDPGPVQLVSLQDSSDNEISGNILDGGNVGLALFGASSRNLAFRNVFIAPSDEPAFVDATAVTNRFVNNTHYMCGGVADNAPDTQIANMMQSNLATDFTSANTHNFDLAPGSAGIDAGTDFGYDMLPNIPLRFLGAAPDLGAVETH